MGVLILAVVLITFTLYYFWSKNRWGFGRKYVLRQEARRLLNMTPEAADETIDRLMKSLRKRYPNRSEEWYLEKLVYDLERDR